MSARRFESRAGLTIGSVPLRLVVWKSTWDCAGPWQDSQPMVSSFQVVSYAPVSGS